jgi:hypothetical protein
VRPSDQPNSEPCRERSIAKSQLSASPLLATPYGWTYEMTVIAIPLVFLVSDQIRCGRLRGEQTVIIALFAVCFCWLSAAGAHPSDRRSWLS